MNILTALFVEKAGNLSPGVVLKGGDGLMSEILHLPGHGRCRGMIRKHFAERANNDII